jgi:hypothetical protein
MRQWVLLVVIVAFAVSVARLDAQIATDARLLVTVVDPTGAVLPNATVSVEGTEAATSGARFNRLIADHRGQATVDRLVPGRYSIRAEFPGFSPVDLHGLRLRAGDNKHVAVLPLKRVEDSVTVGRSAVDVATDRTDALGSILTRAQVQALSDDPDQLRRQLLDLAGPGAIIRVDSFEGQPLPPKAQIKSIRIVRDQFAAENHLAASTVEIVTQPGAGPLRGSALVGLFDGRLDGRNPLVPARSAGYSRTFSGTLNRTLIKDRADVSLLINGAATSSTPQLYAATAAGPVAENVNLRSEGLTVAYSGAVNYALTRDQALRIMVTGSHVTRGNLGVGQRDLRDRAYMTDFNLFGIRLRETGPLGRRFVTNTKVALDVQRWETRSATEAPSVVVQDAFTSGGAQKKGTTRQMSFLVQQDFDYIRGRQAWKAGVLVEGGAFRSAAASNYLGTYFYESLETYSDGRPQSYTQTIGDPSVAYGNVQAGLFLQNEIRPRKNLALNLGLRYESQVRTLSRTNLAPRLGVTWSPTKSGRVSLRASWGVFYDWFSMSTYAQSLQSTGGRYREIHVINPGSTGLEHLADAAPPNRYLLDDQLRLPRNVRFSVGVSGSMRRLNLTVVYAHVRGTGLLVGQNMNAPDNGVRPDPGFGNVIKATAAGETRAHSVSGNVSVNLARPEVTAAKPPLVNWRRGLSLFSYFNVNTSGSNTEGAFAVPASGDLAQEWSASGPKWSTSLLVSSGIIRNVAMSWNTVVTAASPFTIRTGRDDNGDLIFNDRPLGVGRNTAAGARTVHATATLSYTVPGPSRYRTMFTLQVENPTNRANYSGYSGVMTSPFYLRPTAVSGVRRVTFSSRVSF